jgi:outer membrane protein OmpA-like peptidoglycan-associated protein
MSSSKILVGTSGLLLLIALATPGCATKKYVGQQVGTVDQRVSAVDKKQTEALANLESKEQKDVSRVEERAMSAENKAGEAARAAETADRKAVQAGDSARAANDAAMQAQKGVGEVHREVENIDNMKSLATQDVLFGFNKASLTDEEKAKLDAVVQQAQGLTRYQIEVEGFTDRSGAQDYNLVLSRRRADTVVRYLLDHSIPLRRVHVIGLGESPKPAEKVTRAVRKEMRKVTVSLYVPETVPSQSAATPPSQPAPPAQPAAAQAEPAPSPR